MSKHFLLIFTLEFGACLLFREKWAFQKVSKLKNWSQLMQSFILKTFFPSFRSQLFTSYTYPRKPPTCFKWWFFSFFAPIFILRNKNPSKRCGIKWKMTGLDQILHFYLSACKNFDFEEKKIKTKIISVKSKI